MSKANPYSRAYCILLFCQRTGQAGGFQQSVILPTWNCYNSLCHCRCHNILLRWVRRQRSVSQLRFTSICQSGVRYRFTHNRHGRRCKCTRRWKVGLSKILPKPQASKHLESKIFLVRNCGYWLDSCLFACRCDSVLPTYAFYRQLPLQCLHKL
jgi:hypothetical protein